MAQEVYDAGDLLLRAEKCLESFPPQIEGARKFYEKCLQQHPDNTQVLEAFADFLLRYIPLDSEKARCLLERAVALEPNGGSGQKYFSLAQFADGHSSLRLFMKGIEILLEELKDSKGTSAKQGMKEEEVVRAIRRQISTAKCSVAELYMTDLCDEEDAKAECLRHINEAIEEDSSNFEAHHLAATFYKIIGCHEDGERAAARAIDVLRQINTRLDHVAPDEVEGEGEGSRNSLSDGMAGGGGNKRSYVLAAEWELPGAEARTNFSKTLIDLLMLEEAGEVILGLIEEDEENVEFWHLLAIVCMLSEEFDDALSHIAKAKELITSGRGDEELLPTVESLKDEVLRRAAAKGNDRGEENEINGCKGITTATEDGLSREEDAVMR